MEVGDFIRNIGVHIRGVLLGAVLAGLVAVGLSVIMPHDYSTTSTLRVIPPTGTLDKDLLSTAVDWYVALGNVPSVLNETAARTEPPTTAAAVREQATLAPGGGPGEVTITVSAPDEQDALAVNHAMTQVVVEQVANDRRLRLGETQLSVLVPPESNGPSGSGKATLFITGFLVGFVVLATGAGFLHRLINWRVNSRVLRALGEENGVRTYPVPADLAVFLANQSREGPQTWMAAGPGIDEATWDAMAAQVRDLGGSVDVLQVSEHDARPELRAGAVLLPSPNDASAEAISAVGVIGAPAAVVVPKGVRSSALRRVLRQLDDVDVTPLAIGLSKSRGRGIA